MTVQVSEDTAAVLLVNGRTMFRQMIAHCLSEHEGIGVAAQVGTVSQAMSLLDSTDFDLAIVDADLPDGDGVELAKYLRTWRPALRLIVLSDSVDEDSLIAAIRAGADGHVAKEASFDELLCVVRSVMAGQPMYDSAVCCSALRRLVAHQSEDQHRDGHHTAKRDCLSPRESQVAEMLSRGMTNKEIASTLAISLSTTKTHVSKIFKCLNITSRRELLPRFFRVVKPAVGPGTPFGPNGHHLSG